MSLKNSIFLFILLSASFSAYSQWYEVTISQKHVWPCSPEVGKVLTQAHFEEMCVGTRNKADDSYIKSIGVSSGIVRAKTGPYKGKAIIAYVKNVAGCPAGSVINPSTGMCESICESLSGKKTGDKTWDYFKYGSRPTICARSCELITSGLSLCTTAGGDCVGEFVYTGKNCGTGDGMTQGGSVPDKIPEGCMQLNQDQWVCREDKNGDGVPDTAGQYDQSAKCGYSGEKWKCYGGSYAEQDHEMTDPTSPLDTVDTPTSPGDPNNAPINVSPPPSVEGGNSGDLSGVIQALKEQNHDINNLITELNKDNNENVALILDELQQNQEHLQNISDSIVESINKEIEMYENMKKLEMESTSDIVDAINESNELDGYYNDRILESLNQKSKAIVDAINGIDTGSGNSGSISGDSCSSFTCEGDEIACYIARKEWQNQCESQNLFADGNAGDNFDKGLKDYINSPDSDINNLYGESKTLALDKYTSENGFNIESGCPAPAKIDMGEALGFELGSFDVSYQPICDLSEILKIFLHLSAFLAVVWAFVKFG
ncbi:virulence factor TspB C-terminal domain-related protein [Vibrio nigripulchritudo]|uniref:virulence factor TspB C-terminal domain-related protein n=1 Tax=Vibrio nigripulchritudo TaxID=28173 RepID=UPI0003B20420|nr:virulence factor TspB C-terminal domain-related protein [Vibrio nigripulchritudo]CCO41388.1 exported hypothetical protein [Vibrio nigripulchritudo SFn135]